MQIIFCEVRILAHSIYNYRLIRDSIVRKESLYIYIIKLFHGSNHLLLHIATTKYTVWELHIALCS